MKDLPFDIDHYARLGEASRLYGYPISDMDERERLAVIGWLGEYLRAEQRGLMIVPREPHSETATWNIPA